MDNSILGVFLIIIGTICISIGIVGVIKYWGDK